MPPHLQEKESQILRPKALVFDGAFRLLFHIWFSESQSNEPTCFSPFVVGASSETVGVRRIVWIAAGKSSLLVLQSERKSIHRLYPMT
jgi:hypothetical protein